MGQKLQILELFSKEDRWWSSIELMRKFGGNALFETLDELLEKKRIEMQDDAVDKKCELPKLKYKITDIGKRKLAEWQSQNRK